MRRAHILVVDDQLPNRELLRRVLKLEGYEVSEAENGREALDAVRGEVPDLILLDAIMPELDGFGVIKALKRDPATRLVPIVMVTTLDTLADKLKAVDLGVDDFLNKPVNLTELTTRVRSLLALKRFTDELEHAARVLEGLASVVEKRDGYTGLHCQRVGAYARLVGAALGLDDESLDVVRLGGVLHDLGKVAMPDEVLRKPGRLSDEERRLIESHAPIGADLCLPMRTMERSVPILRHHHERLDGTGYPGKLRGEQISLEVRVVTVVDIYDALSTRRPYREPTPPETSMRILREEAARGWWDPQVVDCLADLIAGRQIADAADEVEARAAQRAAVDLARPR
jgi:putative two-component system response regulator